MTKRRIADKIAEQLKRDLGPEALEAIYSRMYELGQETVRQRIETLFGTRP